MSAANLPNAMHLEMMNAQRQEMMKAISTASQDEATREDVEGCQVVSTMWCDPSRQDDTALGGFGCWGDNITDVRLEYRIFRVDEKGNKDLGTQTQWMLCQILQISNNTKDSRAVMDAKHFKLIAADDDGGNKRRTDLEELTGKLRTNFPSEGFVDPRMRASRVAVALRMAFVPVPDASKGWGCEVRYVAYGYNTTDPADPSNLLLFGDTMNTSVFAEEPARSAGFQPLYTKLMSTVCPDSGSADADLKMRCYATAVESTDRGLADMGKETAAESAAMAAQGKGTSVRTGPSTLPGSSACAWHIALPLQKVAPPPRLRSLGGGGLGASGGPQGECIYRSMSAAAEPDDGVDPVFRSAAESRTPAKVAAKEGRIGIGSYVEDAKAFPIKTPVAKQTPAIATGIYIMTVPMGACPDDATVVEACRKLKAYYKQASELGTQLDDRLSEQAVKEGLTEVGPVSKKSKLEIAGCIGAEKADATMPGTAPLAPTIAVGRPLLAGVPRD